jgi:AcrR family transcriptional regulator
MTETEPRTRRGRGRRPAREVREQILQAAGELLLEEGMAAFTIEKAAARAGASRMTIYKWWPSRGTLALEGYFSVVRPTLEFHDTDDIRADLTAQVRSLAHLLSDTSAGRVIAELIGAAQTDPELAAAFRTRYAEPRRQLAVEAITRGIERGQLRDDIDPEVIDNQLWGACYHRLLIYGGPFTDDFAEALVDNLMTGLRRGVIEAGAG